MIRGLGRFCLRDGLVGLGMVRIPTLVREFFPRTQVRVVASSWRLVKVAMLGWRVAVWSLLRLGSCQWVGMEVLAGEVLVRCWPSATLPQRISETTKGGNRTTGRTSDGQWQVS